MQSQLVDYFGSMRCPYCFGVPHNDPEVVVAERAGKRRMALARRKAGVGLSELDGEVLDGVE